MHIQQNRALKLLLVKDIYKFGVLKFVYKQQNNLLPNLFIKPRLVIHIDNASIYSHNTRQIRGLHIIK